MKLTLILLATAALVCSGCGVRITDHHYHPPGNNHGSHDGGHHGGQHGGHHQRPPSQCR